MTARSSINSGTLSNIKENSDAIQQVTHQLYITQTQLQKVQEELKNTKDDLHKIKTFLQSRYIFDI